MSTRSRVFPRADPKPHGTQASYKNGCRCDPCRNAATRAMKEYRLHLLRSGSREIDATGTRRRILALCVNGWTQRLLATEAGITARTVGRIATGQTTVVNLTIANAVKETYDRLWDRPGPGNYMTRRTARLAGGVPPLAWDDDQIDDPAALPCVDDSPRRVADVEDIEWILMDAPVTTARQLADRFGCTPDAIQQACRRAERPDLLAWLARNAQVAA